MRRGAGLGQRRASRCFSRDGADHAVQGLLEQWAACFSFLVACMVVHFRANGVVLLRVDEDELTMGLISTQILI